MVYNTLLTKSANSSKSLEISGKDIRLKYLFKDLDRVLKTKAKIG